ncbi:MAG: hypothetical protein WC529_08400 [Candidatus Margulisiibacteriota bacterium]
MNTALYLGGNRRIRRPFRLVLNPLHAGSEARTLISSRAVAQAPARIFDVNWKGVQHENRSTVPPHIFLRSQQAVTLKVFIAPSELDALADHFQLPANVVRGAFFTGKEKGVFSKRKELTLSPRWQELCDPAWQDALLGWIADRNGLPEISEIGQWHIPFRKCVILPGLTGMATMNNANRTGRYGVRFEQFGPVKRALLDHGNGTTNIYELVFDPATGRDQMTSISCVKFIKNGPVGDFNRATFRGLFGLRPLITTYECSKRAGRHCLDFCEVDGLRFFARHSLVVLEDKQMYYFRFTRDGSCLTIECYLDPEYSQLHGRKNLSLHEGCPRNEGFSLEKP